MSKLKLVTATPQDLFYDSEKIKIKLWCKWPSYDFIFGIPTKKNRHYKIERAFFQWRDTKKKKVKAGFYLDEVELNQIIKGFQLIKKHYKKK